MMRHGMSVIVMIHEMSDVVMRHEMSDMWWVTWDRDMRWVTRDRDMRWMTWDEWHEMSDIMMRHEMSDMSWVICDEFHVINRLGPYTFCEFPFLNPLVKSLLNLFLIPWGQAEWRNDETLDEWHEIETDMSARHLETLFLSFRAEGRCWVGISYCRGDGQRSAVILCGD